MNCVFHLRFIFLNYFEAYLVVPLSGWTMKFVFVRFLFMGLCWTLISRFMFTFYTFRMCWIFLWFMLFFVS